MEWREAAARLRAYADEKLRQRVTRSGWAFSIAIVIVALAAFLSANNLLFLLLAAMLATLMISNLVGRLSLAGIELDFAIPEHIAARRKVVARIRVRNEKLWIPSFSIHLKGTTTGAFAASLYFPAIPPRGRLEETVEIVFERRGSHTQNSLQFSTRFPFGFTERRARVTLPREIIVYPCLDPQPGFEEALVSVSGGMEAQQRGRGHDFYRIRPYEPLESARHVDWRATAHTGELQVREFAREQDPLVEIFFDLYAPPAHKDWFERAVDCAAYLTWTVMQKEARVRFRTEEFDAAIPAEGDVYTILKYLALVSPNPTATLIEPGDADSYQVVFTVRPEHLDPGWSDALLLGPGAFPGGAEQRRAGARS
ncbi:MAG: DUF58 domain-containing protein [Bryobacteraceae bacterium]|nr:DUF58 domain-containing protein [Bryobacteraceae bacterium]